MYATSRRRSRCATPRMPRWCRWRPTNCRSNRLRPAYDRESAPLDLLDLIGLGAAGCDDFNAGALGLADERAREGRGNRDLAFLGICFGLADDLPHHFFVSVFVDQSYGRAELDGIA